jgi:hypothetical protein
MTIILAFGMIGARAEVLAAQCSSYYISEINLVSTADSEAGHVQTFVGFGPSKEEAEKNALDPAHTSALICRPAWAQIVARASMLLRMPPEICFIWSTWKPSSASPAVAKQRLGETTPRSAAGKLTLHACQVRYRRSDEDSRSISRSKELGLKRARQKLSNPGRSFLGEYKSKRYQAGQNSYDGYHRRENVVTLKSPPLTVWHFFWAPFINARAEWSPDNAVIAPSSDQSIFDLPVSDGKWSLAAACRAGSSDETRFGCCGFPAIRRGCISLWIAISVDSAPNVDLRLFTEINWIATGEIRVERPPVGAASLTFVGMFSAGHLVFKWRWGVYWQ